MDCNRYTDQRYIDIIKNSSLAAGTKTSYVKQLMLLGKKLDGASLCDIINNPDKYMSLITAKYPNEGTRSAVLSVILSVMKYSDIKTKYPAIYQKWNDDHFQGLKQKLNAKFENFIPADKTIDAAITWKDILRGYNRVAREKPYSLEHVTLAMYTLIPPRRHNDYWKLALVRDDKDMSMVESGGVGAGGSVSGYIDLRKSPVVLTVLHYKTKKLYDTWTKELPKLLEVIVRGHLTRRSDCQKYLFVTETGEPFKNNESFAVRNNKVLKAALGYPKASVNVLRHAAATHIYQSKMTPLEKKQYALDMGHSLNMQAHYYVDEAA